MAHHQPCYLRTLSGQYIPKCSCGRFVRVENMQSGLKIGGACLSSTERLVALQSSSHEGLFWSIEGHRSRVLSVLSSAKGQAVAALADWLLLVALCWTLAWTRCHVDKSCSLKLDRHGKDHKKASSSLQHP